MTDDEAVRIFLEFERVESAIKGQYNLMCSMCLYGYFVCVLEVSVRRVCLFVCITVTCVCVCYVCVCVSNCYVCNKANAGASLNGLSQIRKQVRLSP